MENVPNLNLDEVKMNKLNELQALGVTVFPQKFERTDTIAAIKEKHAEIEHEKSEDKVITSGRVHAIRSHGKTMFVDIADASGKIQVYVRKNDIGTEEFDLFSKHIDTGDIIGVEGNVFRTKLGEITIWMNGFTVLSKSICSMPEKFHGLKDVETRYRQRYLDLIMDDGVKDIFRKRSRILSLLRGFLSEKEFMEFETPVLQPVYGGANARPFTTYHNFLEQKLYLRIAPELYLKRLVVGGFEKVFEIAKNFRNEDIDTFHNPEFTMVEIYEAYSDYNDMMDLTEGIISHIIRETCGKAEVPFGEQTINFASPWQRLTMEEAVKIYSGIDVLQTPLEELRRIAEKEKMEDFEKAVTVGNYLVLFFEHFAEKKLINPTFIHDFPLENSPLAKSHRSKPGYTERFELFIAGAEIANGFSELNDPLDQMDRFQKQDEKRRMGDVEAQMIDYDYINALGYGMPPTGGVGIGIDRLVMLATNSNSIKEVILFPQMKILKAKPSKDENAPVPAEGPEGPETPGLEAAPEMPAAPEAAVSSEPVQEN
ncbi:lysine--tRNA ligase [Methanosarcina sp. KYL-1]|uniref:lysine--tRNA ligase n=1 Tax=Methanosarcina sp. KYL-1 TaxID=2602068 RepID=UPI002100F785|nr:lysine--tRNA ligase [Methanosarcina sp. KYL-1]MCQ1535319.1 lysine--tRNA ligase [Methanosarcina sp. KYL-1]